MFYLRDVQVGLDFVKSLGDGYGISLRWFRAFTSNPNNKIAYNIYYSTEMQTVFSSGPKFVCESTSATIKNLDPGQLYFFSVRPIEYNPLLFNINLLTTAYDNLKIVPTTRLISNISSTDLIIPTIDVSDFPSFGVISIGREFIQYNSINTTNNSFILNSINGRGYNSTHVSEHEVDGYDGYTFYSTDIFYKMVGESDLYDRIYSCQSRFDFDHYSYTSEDGYKQEIKDLLNSDNSGADLVNGNFPSYPGTGYQRTDPLLLLNGYCVNSYFGGETYCADGYDGAGVKIRGLNAQNIINQREEQLLSLTGEPVKLLQRQYTGIRCKCYTPNRESPMNTCPYCYGEGFVMGYNDYFNPKRSDGRILIRFSPTDENIILGENGMESQLGSPQVEVWGLSVPTIHVRDVLIRFDANNNEEFRYEVISVNRNKTLNNGSTTITGAQKMRIQRIRKFDKKYRITAFRDTSSIPKKLFTNFTNAVGIGLHNHEITTNEHDPSTWQQTSQIGGGHSHQILWKDGQLVVEETLGHSHTLVII